MKLKLNINGKLTTVEAPETTPLLWVLRDHLKMTGTKFGCGMAQCGACTVLVDGNPIRSCVTSILGMENKKITTIEGLKDQEPIAQKVIQAWEDKSVVQCGYCQSGQIVSATALLKSNPKPSDREIDEFMSGNICRCSTYKRIRDAIKSAALDMTVEATGNDDRTVVKQYIPSARNSNGGSNNVA
jgi:isoquinoline 1-oxidoreductase alpha subunit